MKIAIKTFKRNWLGHTLSKQNTNIKGNSQNKTNRKGKDEEDDRIYGTEY